MRELLRISKKGFTLIELLITIAIVGIIAAIAIPSYLDYSKRAHFSEIVKATAPFKLGVSECYSKTSDLTTCDSGANGVPTDKGASGGITSIATVNGVITATPAAQNGIVATDTYVLTPTVTNGQITWASTGGAVTNGLAE